MTSLTSHLPLQNLNTHPKTSLHSHNTTQSIIAFSPTHHRPYITSQNLSLPNLQNILLNHPPHIYHPKLIAPPLTLKHTAKSTNTLSPTHHHTPQLKSQKSLITQPAKLIDTQLYQKQHHTHHTNKLAPPHKPIISQHIVTSPTSHLPPQTHNTNQTKKLTDTNNIKKTTHPPHKQTDTTPTNQSSPGTPYITSLTPATLNSQHCPRTLKPTTQSTNSLLPTYHHTSTHIT